MGVGELENGRRSKSGAGTDAAAVATVTEMIIATIAAMIVVRLDAACDWEAAVRQLTAANQRLALFLSTLLSSIQSSFYSSMDIQPIFAVFRLAGSVIAKLLQ